MRALKARKLPLHIWIYLESVGNRCANAHISSTVHCISSPCAAFGASQFRSVLGFIILSFILLSVSGSYGMDSVFPREFSCMLASWKPCCKLAQGFCKSYPGSDFPPGPSCAICPTIMTPSRVLAVLLHHPESALEALKHIHRCQMRVPSLGLPKL